MTQKSESGGESDRDDEATFRWEAAIAFFAGKVICFFIKCSACQECKAWWLRYGEGGHSAADMTLADLASFPVQNLSETCTSCQETKAWWEGFADGRTGKLNRNPYSYEKQTLQWGGYQSGHCQTAS